MFSKLFKSACELDHVELSILNSITGKIFHLYGKKSESESSLAYLHADMKEEGNIISLKIERYFVCKNQLQYLEKPLKF